MASVTAQLGARLNNKNRSGNCDEKISFLNFNLPRPKGWGFFVCRKIFKKI
jgi:hypothetical protein